MKINKSYIVSGSIGAILGVCSIWGIGALSGSKASSLFSKKAELSMYEKVADAPDEDDTQNDGNDNLCSPHNQMNSSLSCVVFFSQ